MARTVQKRIGAVRNVGAMGLLMMNDPLRRHRNGLVPRPSYLSLSADSVEIPAKVGVTFELLD